MSLRDDYNNRNIDDIVHFICYVIIYGTVVYGGVKIILKIINAIYG